MDIKEAGAVGVFVVGGAVYGISQYGLNDVLSEEMRPIAEVSLQERPAYMEQVTAEFKEAFDSYGLETETYTYVGLSAFSTSPSTGTFVEVVTQDSPVPPKEIKGLKEVMDASMFCDQDEMTMFTDKGWGYSFTMQDSNKRTVYAIECKPLSLKLRPVS